MLKPLASVICAVALCGCGSPSNARFDEQADAYDRQLERGFKNLAKDEEMMKRSEKLLERSEAAADRYDRLLDRAEAEQKRREALLELEEKNAGISTR